MSTQRGVPIAVIGLSARLPDADNVQDFWHNLIRGHESLASYSEESQLALGLPPAALADPNFVKKGTYLKNPDHFDAGFFGFNPREAEIMDPQQRLLLECAWEALESAGYGGLDRSGRVGVFAGASLNSYLLTSLLRAPRLLSSVGGYQIMVANDKDFLATRISYKLNLTGPSLTVQTACSTSLVAVHMACQAILSGQCELALAGGVALRFPQGMGYTYAEGMIFSPDGHCRPFDKSGQGIRGGDGAGLVVLKRLDSALRDGDSIRAVILGSAVNNDGSAKMGYSAPSVDGQAAVIQSALEMAGVDPASIQYVEAHGTATPLGDPIEIAALTQAYRAYTAKSQYCAIGSVKSNLGHLDAAAGVAGLIKAILSLENGRIPASLHFVEANPQIDFLNSPFFVNAELRDWPAGDQPRRAAVSSSGIGGTNSHVILEQAPTDTPSTVHWPSQVLVLSAKSAPALESSRALLANHLAANPNQSLADVCHTLQSGRMPFAHRHAFVCSSIDEAVATLRGTSLRRTVSAVADNGNRPVAFLFSGQGSQYRGMAAGLLESSPVFRRIFHSCAEILQPELDFDLTTFLTAGSDDPRIQQTAFAQPALFALEYSLARTWMEYGVHPVAMLGHSIGEYAAACIAGVFGFEDALRLVALRGRLMQEMLPGTMMAVPLAEPQLAGYLSGSISLAALNRPNFSTVSGPAKEIDALEARLQLSGITCRRLHTSHAFHSAMMQPAVERFEQEIRKFKLLPPELPFVSNVSGTWIQPDQATDPHYWAQHLREPVRFSAGIQALSGTPGLVFLEVGPGQVLTTFARDCLRGQQGFETIPSLPHPQDKEPADSFFLDAVARLWASGVPIDWNKLHEGERLHRIPLPTYPFQRQRFYVEPELESTRPTELQRKPDVTDWFHVPTWMRSSPPSLIAGDTLFGPWLVLARDRAVGDQIVAALKARGETVTYAIPGAAYAPLDDNTIVMDFSATHDFSRLVSTLNKEGDMPRCVAYVAGAGEGRAGFHDLIRLAQAFGDHSPTGMVDWLIVSQPVFPVLGTEEIDPFQALLRGPSLVIPREFPYIRSRFIDLGRDEGTAKAISELVREPAMEQWMPAVTYRQGQRWRQSFETLRLPAPKTSQLREKGVYLITGGAGGMGRTLAAHFASACHARLALTGRTKLPDRSHWSAWLEQNPEDNRTSRLIHDIQRWESLGAEVLYLQADAGSRMEMEQAIAEIHRTFGPLHGVVHAAGFYEGSLIQLKQLDGEDPVLTPKVEGTLILASLLEGETLDFFVLASSVDAFSPLPGSVDYSAANAFLDAFAVSQYPRHNVTSVNWSVWNEVGMAAERKVSAAEAEYWTTHVQAGIKPQEGVDAFLRLLNAKLPQIAVTPKPILNFRASDEQQLRARAEVLWSKQEELLPEAPPSGSTRPDLTSAFASPENEVQTKMLAIWQEMLGVGGMGIDDNFFELGGHSLLATGVLARIRSAFGISIPLRSIFEAPTVRTLSQLVAPMVWKESPETAADSEEREEFEL